MQQLIEQLVTNTGITVEDANYIFTAISSQLVSKVPAMQQVIEDVFENVEAEKLKKHINKMIILLQQQQCAETFGAWIIPRQVGRIIRSGSDTIF